MIRLIGFNLILLMGGCNGEEDAGNKKIFIDHNNVRKPIKINNDTIFVDLSRGLTRDPEEVKLNLNIFLNKVPDVKDKAIMLAAKQTNRINPDLYKIILEDEEFYWLSFQEDSRSLDHFTRFNFGSKIVDAPKLRLYFKDYNSDGESDHLVIIIDLKWYIGY